ATAASARRSASTSGARSQIATTSSVAVRWSSSSVHTTDSANGSSTSAKAPTASAATSMVILVRVISKKRAAHCGAALPFSLAGILHHAAHVRRGHGGTGVVLRLLRHHRFGGDEETGDRGRVLQCGADNLRRVDDAGLHEIDVGLVLR